MIVEFLDLSFIEKPVSYSNPLPIVGNVTSAPNHTGFGDGGVAGRVSIADNQGPANSSRIVLSPATTNATVAKASAGVLYAIRGSNNAAALRVIKLYNKATAPTVGTDTPVLTIPVSPGAFNFEWALGRYFSAGIGYALTQLLADTDTTAMVLNDMTINVEYR